MARIDIYNTLHKNLLQKKLNSPLGFAIISVLAIALGSIAAKGLSFSLLAIAGIFAIGITIYAFVNESFGIAFVVLLSTITAVIDRIIGVLPWGTLIEVFIFIVFIGIILRKAILSENTFDLHKDPIAIALLCLLTYQFLEILNPNRPNKVGSLFVIKRSVCLLLFYLVCIYNFTNKKNIIRLLKYWLVLAFIVGFYGCKQEWLGFFQFETNWLFGGLVKITLIFVDGRFRKFSFLDSPTNFGMMMATAAVLGMILLTGKFSVWRKLALTVIIIPMLLGLAYSGTRTAYVMLPAGLFLFFLMNINRRITIVIGAVCAVGVAALFYLPSKDPNILRIRSAFNPKGDASFNVRDINRAKIQPYIYKNPIGSGLATVGGNGLRYNPAAEVAGFPPDSEYLKWAIEGGPIGYFLLISFYIVVMLHTVYRFFRCENVNVKTIYAAVACAIFTIIIANYSQETGLMFPNDLYSTFLFAISASLYKFDITYLRKKYPAHETKIFALT